MEPIRLAVAPEHVVASCKQKPRNRLSRAAGEAAPSGGSEAHEVASVGAIVTCA